MGAQIKKKYRSEAEYCADQMLKFVGSEIVGVTMDPTGEFMGLEVLYKGHYRVVLWVERDAEGNGGGFIRPEPQGSQLASKEETSARDGQ
jgi:hypothetical protein